jgi:hypothetical protein
MKAVVAAMCVLGLASPTRAMYLDKNSNELVLKIVYAGDGKVALDQVTSLASAAKPGLATPVIARMNGSVRMFTLHLDPSIGKIRGFAPRVDIVGVSLDGLRTGLGATKAVEMEKTILTGDGLIFVVGPNEPDAKAVFDRISSELHVVGTNGAKTPVAIIATGPVDVKRVLGVKDIPVSTGLTANASALKTIVKPTLLELVKRSSE